MATVAAGVVGLDAGAVHAGGSGGLAAGAIDVRQAFAVSYDDGVRVRISSGRRFSVTVSDLEDRVLEYHKRLSVSRLLRLRSNYFTVTPTAFPTPEYDDVAAPAEVV